MCCSEQASAKELKEQVAMLEESNTDLQANMESCGVREMEHLEFTQKISDKNARVQSENITLNSAVSDCICVRVCMCIWCVFMCAYVRACEC